MSFSKKHYRFVSPPSDTPAELAWRKRDNECRAIARAEQVERFPVIDSTETFDAAIAFFEARVKQLHSEATK